jgi:glycosyltransferase 2 family protein
MDNTSPLAQIWSFVRKPVVSLALRVVVSLLLLVYLARISAFEGIAQAFRHIQPVYLLGFFLLYFLSVGLQSLRWKYLLRAWDVPRPLSILFRSIMTGLFLNNFLPGGLGGDVYRIYAGGRDTGKIEAVAATIFYERILGYGSLVILGLITLTIRADFARDWLFWVLLSAVLFGLIILSGLSSIPALERLVQRLGDRSMLARKLRLIDWLRSFRLRKMHPGILAGVFLVSFLIQFIDVLSFYVVATAIQIPVKLTDLLLFVPLLYLAILLPVSLNGIGVRETVFVMFSGIWGISSTNAVAFSLTVFTLGLAGSLLGGIFYWFDRSLSATEIPQTRMME